MKLYKLLIILGIVLMTFLSCSTLVNISSEPTGAKVVVDGKELGVTPTQVQLADGSWIHYKIILIKDGYEPIQRELTMELKVLPVAASVPLFFAPFPLIWAYGPASNQYFLMYKEKKEPLN